MQSSNKGSVSSLVILFFDLIFIEVFTYKEQTNP